MNNNTPNQPEKKRGCLYGCLTAIGIIIVLLILVGSCSSVMNNSNSELEEEVVEQNENSDTENTSTDLIQESMLEISLYFTELSVYTPEYINNDPQSAEEALKTLQENIVKTVNNIKEIPLSRLQQYLINISMNQNNATQNLIEYASTQDMSYYNEALEAMARANTEIEEMNEYLNTQN